MRRPNKVNVCGKVYRIEYTKKPIEHSDKSVICMGEINYVDQVISVYDKDRDVVDLWDTILHEVVHALIHELRIRSLQKNHDDIDRLGVGLSDTLFRNGWMKP